MTDLVEIRKSTQNTSGFVWKTSPRVFPFTLFLQIKCYNATRNSEFKKKKKSLPVFTFAIK